MNLKALCSSLRIPFKYIHIYIWNVKYMFISTVLSLPGNCKILNSRNCFANFCCNVDKKKSFCSWITVFRNGRRLTEDYERPFVPKLNIWILTSKAKNQWKVQSGGVTWYEHFWNLTLPRVWKTEQSYARWETREWITKPLWLSMWEMSQKEALTLNLDRKILILYMFGFNDIGDRG